MTDTANPTNIADAIAAAVARRAADTRPIVMPDRPARRDIVRNRRHSVAHKGISSRT